MADQPFQIYTIKTQRNGDFRIRVDAPEGDGIHAAVIVSEDGAKETALFRYDGEAATNETPVLQYEEIAVVSDSEAGSSLFPWTEIQQSLNFGFLWIPIVILTLLILTLVANTLRLAKKIDKSHEDKQEQEYTKQALLFGIVSLLITLTAFVFFDYRSYRNIDNYVLPELANLTNRLPDESEIRQIVQIDGEVVDPSDGSGVENVELTVGDTTIRTGESGLFSFEDVDTGIGIRLNHPELRSAVIFRYPEGNHKFYFNTQLYNVLYRAMDAEASANYDKLYGLVHPQVRAKHSLDAYLKKYQFELSRQDLPIQNIELKNAVFFEKKNIREVGQSFTPIIELTVIKDVRIRKYIFAKSGDLWYLVL